MVDIESIPTADLIDEMKRRFRGVLIVTEAEVKGRTDQYETLLSYCGGVNLAMGLAHSAFQTLLDSRDEERDDKSDDE